LNTCGITTGSGNFTETQLENCLKPLVFVYQPDRPLKSAS
jgi:hypothetical protein